MESSPPRLIAPSWSEKSDYFPAPCTRAVVALRAHLTMKSRRFSHLFTMMTVMDCVHLSRGVPRKCWRRKLLVARGFASRETRISCEFRRSMEGGLRRQDAKRTSGNRWPSGQAADTIRVNAAPLSQALEPRSHWIAHIASRSRHDEDVQDLPAARPLVSGNLQVTNPQHAACRVAPSNFCCMHRPGHGVSSPGKPREFRSPDKWRNPLSCSSPNAMVSGVRRKHGRGAIGTCPVLPLQAVQGQPRCRHCISRAELARLDVEERPKCSTLWPAHGCGLCRTRQSGVGQIGGPSRHSRASKRGTATCLFWVWACTCS